MATTSGKFCRDCKWQADNAAIPTPAMWTCHAPKNIIQTDLVSGEPSLNYRYCATLRGIPAPNGCGVEGAWWEAK